MSQSLTTKIRGLYTFPNDFSSVPEGALAVADNIVIDRDSIAEPRRGFTYLASTAGRADFLNASDRGERLFFYDDTILAQAKNGSTYTLDYFNPTDGWHDITSTFAVKTVATGTGGGFDPDFEQITKSGHGYRTGLAVVLSIDGGSLPTGLAAGTYYVIVVGYALFKLATTYDNALAGTAVAFSDVGSNGQVATFTPSAVFDPPSTTVKTRAVQAKQNLYLTTKDGVVRVDNRDSAPVLAGVPQALDIYNTANDITTASSPDWLGDDERVAYRVVYGIKDANGNLILSAPSGRGIITNTSGSAGCPNVHVAVPIGLTTSHFIQLYRSTKVDLSTEPSDELRLSYEAQLTSSNITTGLAVIVDNTDDALLFGPALYTNASQQGSEMANFIPPKANDIAVYRDFMFYAGLSEQQTYILTLKTVEGLVTGDTLTIGATTFEANANIALGIPRFDVATGGTDAVNIAATAKSIVFNINFYQSLYYAAYISDVNDLPGKILIKSYSVNAPVFSLTSNRGVNFLPPLPTSGTLQSSTAEIALNGIACSKYLEHEHVPIPYRWYPGSKDSASLRILPLRDSLFILKEDGVYRLWGTDPNNFQIALLDATANCIAPDTACVLNNMIFCLTTQGVVTISETGVTIMSRPIEGNLLDLLQINPSILYLQSFAFASESQRSYYLYLPTTSTDTRPTQYYRYNTITNNWTRGTLAKNCGGVNPYDDLIYLADPDDKYLDVERKTKTIYDYSDYLETETISSVSNKTVTVTNALSYAPGQIIAQFPVFVARTVAMGAGGGFNETTNEITFNGNGFLTGTKVVMSATGTFPVGLSARTYWVIRISANAFKLADTYDLAIAGTPLDFTDQGQITKTATFTPSNSVIWGTITTVGTTTLDVAYKCQFTLSSAVLLDPIFTEMKWVPATFQNPGMNKQVREVTLMFLADFYGTADISFATDASPSTLTETITGSIPAPWGNFPWGSAPYGGLLRRRPVRVMVPRIHQRGSFLSIGFSHEVAFSPWEIQGLSLIGNNISEKVWHQGNNP